MTVPESGGMGEEEFRNFETFENTMHFFNKAKQRGIATNEVRRAIDVGTIIPPGEKPSEHVPREVEQEDVPLRDNHFFFYNLPIPLIIVVDSDKLKKVTAYYDDKAGAKGGSLIRE